jgi:hypothetical protein
MSLLSRKQAEDLAAHLAADVPTYGALDDQAVADLMNGQTVSRNKATLSAAEIYEAIDNSELRALTGDNTANVSEILSLGDSVQVGPTTKARTALLAAFPDPSPSRDALILAVAEDVSLPTSLGLPAVLSQTNVAEARRIGGL